MKKFTFATTEVKYYEVVAEDEYAAAKVFGSGQGEHVGTHWENTVEGEEDLEETERGGIAEYIEHYNASHKANGTALEA